MFFFLRARPDLEGSNCPRNAPASCRSFLDQSAPLTPPPPPSTDEGVPGLLMSSCGREDSWNVKYRFGEGTYEIYSRYRYLWGCIFRYFRLIKLSKIQIWRRVFSFSSFNALGSISDTKAWLQWRPNDSQWSSAAKFAFPRLPIPLTPLRLQRGEQLKSIS